MALQRRLWGAFAFIAYLFLFAPILVIAIASVNPAGITFPPTGVTAQWYLEILSDTRLISAAVVSLLVAGIATMITMPIVVMAALGLRSAEFRGATLIENLFLAPISVPQVVVGLALLIYFNSLGIVGGVTVLVLGHLVITIPYALRTILAALKGFDPELEEAAANLGATRFETVRYVTLPLVRPALIAGAGFAFVMSLTNFTISIFLVGSQTVTLPVQIYEYITFSIEPAVTAIATLIALVSLSIVLLIERVVGVQEISNI